MIRELAALCMSDIVQLLGTLGLLSLGITLTLWGLKRRRRGAILMALFLCLAALVPVALAQIELPPEDSVAQIQTNGPNGDLGWGDWYTAAGAGDHSFQIYVPCTIDSEEPITVELFDPESYDDDPGEWVDLDEIEPDLGDEDDTTFTLLAPDETTIVEETTYTPGGGTSQTWVTFATFNWGTYECGIYTLRVETEDDDQNGWKLRIPDDDPDNTPGTGDEISLGTMETSFQHTSPGCQVFHFFVPDMPEPRSVRLSNFDMDGNTSVVYTAPSDTVHDGTVSGGTVWNNGGGAGYPPPGGDEFTGDDFEPGWWQAELCANINNQYVFDTGGLPFFYNKPPTPEMEVGKDDGTTTYYPGGVLEYTITYANTGTGAALNAELNDILPPSTTFLSCTPPGGESCGETSPGSGIVIFSLGTVEAGESGSVTLRAEVDADAPIGYLTNTVELDYSDILFSDYPPLTATDVNSHTVAPPPPPPPPPDDDGEPSEPGPSEPEPPTPTPIPPTPVPPTPTVEVVTVARLPETGGLPGWFTVVVGIPILIGVAGLVNLALLEVRGRRGDGKRG